jgi:carbon-monoxide dehydrogenase large subunit
MPGVEAVYTGADLVKDDIGTIPTLAIFKRPDGTPMTVPPRRLLAHEIVRYAGEAVAAVVATSRVLAQTAAEAIESTTRCCPRWSIRSRRSSPAHRGVARGARQHRGRHELWRRRQGRRSVCKRAHKVSLDLVSQRLVPSAMEPRSTIAEIEKKTGRLILHVQSQTPARPATCSRKPS